MFLFILLIILLAPKVKAQNYLREWLDETIVLDSESEYDSMITLVDNYFVEQSYLKLLNTDPIVQHYTLNIFLASLITDWPLLIYNNATSEPELQKISDMGCELCIPSDAYGYIHFFDFNETMITKLEMFQKINANGKWFFLTAFAKRQTVENMLRMAFDNQNMLYTLIANWIEAEDAFRITFYDPFSLKNGDIRGSFTSMNIFTNTTEFEILTFLEKFDARLWDLRQYELLVDLFPRPMYAEPVYNKRGDILKYRLLEGEIIETLSQMMNFKIVYSLMNTEKLPGFVMENGTLTHGMALVDSGKVNYSAVTRMITENTLNNTAYLYPIEIFNCYYLVPKLYPVPNISLSGWGLFDTTTIIMIWVSVFCCIIARYFIYRIETKKCPDIFQLASQVIGFQNGISQSISYIKSTSDRLIIISCLMLYLIIGNSFQGLILRQLRERDGSQLSTLKEVLESELLLGSLIDPWDIFKPEENKTEFTIRNRIFFKQIIDFEINGYQRVTDPCKEFQAGRQMAILVREKPGDFLIGSCYNKLTGDDLLHMVPEKAASFQSAHTVPKTSPFITQFNMNILSIFEAGFIELADRENDLMNYIERIKRYKSQSLKSDELQLVRLENLEEAFLTLLVAWIMSFGILLVEIGWHWLEKNWKGWENAVNEVRGILYE